MFRVEEVEKLLSIRSYGDLGRYISDHPRLLSDLENGKKNFGEYLCKNGLYEERKYIREGSYGYVTYLIETKFENDGVHVRLLSRDHRSEIRYEIFRGNLLYLISSLWIYKLTRYIRTSELEEDLRGINVSELTGYKSPTVILSKGFFECILSWGMGMFNPLTPPNPSTGNRLIDLFDLFKGYII